MAKKVRFTQETKLTIKGYRRRTTVPKQVIELLKIGGKDAIRWVVYEDGTIKIERGMKHAKRSL